MDINTLPKAFVLSAYVLVFVLLHHVSGQNVVEKEGFVGGSVILPCTLPPNGGLSWRQATISILIKPAKGAVRIGETPYKGDVSLLNGDDLRISTLKRSRDGLAEGNNTIFTCGYDGTGSRGGTSPSKQDIRLILKDPVKITGVSIVEASGGSITVKAGTSKTLTCFVVPGKPNPPPTYSWSVDNVTVSGQTSSVYIFTPQISTRNIKCTVTNSHTTGSVISTEQATATFNVQFLDTPKLPISSIVIEHRTMVLRCTAEGIPSPSFQWRKSTTEVIISRSADYTIENVQRSAAGDYTCTVRNSVTTHTSTTNLIVQYLDRPISKSNYTVIENNSVTLQCSAEGNPLPSYQWRMSGSSEVSTTSADYTIQNVHRSAAGQHICSAGNSVGSLETTVHLIIQYPPDVTVSYDKSTRTLTCKVEAGVPVEYTFSQWEHQFDGKVLQKLGQEATLKLPDSLTYQDLGFYVCQVSNGIKSPQTGQKLITPQTVPVFEDKQSIELSLGKTDTISLPFYTYSDTPNVKVVWEKSGESSELTSHREETGPVRLMIHGQSVSIEGTVTILTLRDVTQSDEGNYTVTVTNNINGVTESNQISFFVRVSLMTGQTESDVNIGAAVGGGIAGLVAVVIIVTISVLLFRKSRMKSEEATRPPEEQTVVQFQNGRQEGGVYQDLTINPDYVNTSDNQPYASLGEKGQEAANYDQRDVLVDATNHVRDSVTDGPQYEDLPEYIDMYPANSTNSDYVNKKASTDYYNL